MAFPVAARVVGEWLSLVEHLVRDQGVGGSNPLSPTNLFAFDLIELERSANLLSNYSGAESLPRSGDRGILSIGYGRSGGAPGGPNSDFLLQG
jgi:hypothetical protein